MNKSTCDVLIHNGQIITMDSERRIYSTGAVAITGSRIVEVGTHADLRQRFDARETIDAEGGIVHPGFIDAHNHIVHTSCRGLATSAMRTHHPLTSQPGKPESPMRTRPLPPPWPVSRCFEAALRCL